MRCVRDGLLGFVSIIYEHCEGEKVKSREGRDEVLLGKGSQRLSERRMTSSNTICVWTRLLTSLLQSPWLYQRGQCHALSVWEETKECLE